VNSASEINSLHWFFKKKHTLFTVMNSVEKKSMATLCKKQQVAAFLPPAFQTLKSVGSINSKLFFSNRLHLRFK
jgi:hypothetical protein